MALQRRQKESDCRALKAKYVGFNMPGPRDAQALCLARIADSRGAVALHRDRKRARRSARGRVQVEEREQSRNPCVEGALRIFAPPLSLIAVGDGLGRVARL